MTATTQEQVRHCPKCGSIRVHRSRRRGPFEHVLTWFGAAICRCHDCCGRQAWFGVSPLPIGNRDPNINPVLSFAVLVVGLLGSVGVLYWMLTHLLPFSV